jgi:hypothetical protein
MELKIMAYVDNELAPSDIDFVKSHLEQCSTCQNKYYSLLKVKEVTNKMKFKKLPDMYWDEYWQHVYNRIERGISWIFISIGAIIVLLFVLWNFINEILVDQHLHPLLKVGIFSLLVGGVILLISVIREKIMVKRVDKYREIER